MRSLRLRTSLAVVTAALSAAALALAGALIVLTTRLSDTSDELAAAVESVRLGQQSTIDLLLAGRAHDEIVARAHAADLRQSLREAAVHVRSTDEAMLYHRGVSASASYAHALANEDPDTIAVLQGAAFTAISEFVDVNVQDARLARARAERWNHLANWIGLWAILAFALGSVAVMWWLRRAFRPTFELARTLARFSAGDRQARAVEAGPVEVRQMAEQFNELADALRAQADTRATLLGSVAHDLRTPLSALRLSIEILAAKDSPGDAHVRRGLDRLRRQLERFDRLVSDVTELAQAEASDFRLNLQDCDAATIVRDVVGLYDCNLREHPIVVVAPDSGVRIRADPWRLEQVIGNLLTNAMKYSPPMSPVAVSVEETRDGATIAIADRGPGIPLAHRSLLFEAYWRGTVGATPGTGLGLFISRRIVEAHGGRIDVEDRPEGGAVFVVRLPHQPPTPADSRTPS